MLNQFGCEAGELEFVLPEFVAPPVPDCDGNGATCALPGGANSAALSFSFVSLFAVPELSSLATFLVFPETALVSANAQFRLPTTR